MTRPNRTNRRLTEGARGPNPTDVHVGSRLRMRRLMLGMSQEAIAEAFGLSFQQVQKYEKGMNRISSSRLQQAADVLGVEIPFFFEGVSGGQVTGAIPDQYINDFVSSQDGLRLIKAFMRIDSSALRRSIVGLVRDLAEPE
jgi:transcriptional regulator with XRE-family HTH domain